MKSYLIVFVKFDIKIFVALNFCLSIVNQESHAMLIDMKDKRHKALEPMKQPRRQVTFLIAVSNT